MRTTLDLPEGLLRKVKATAAARGVKTSDFVAELLYSALSVDRGDAGTGQKRPIPVTVGISGIPTPALTNAEIEDLILREDIERLGRN